MTKARDIASAAPAPSTVSATEIGYLDGVSSAIQTQLDGKQAINSNVSTTELGYLDGVTSAIQTQIDGKSSTSHNHNSDYIAKTLTTTTGDIIYASSANTPARLGIGSTNQILTVSGGVPIWAAPAGGGKVLQVVYANSSTNTSVASTTYTDTSLSGSITPSSASSKVLIAISQQTALSRSANTGQGGNIQLLRGSTVIWTGADTDQLFIRNGTGNPAENRIHWMWSVMYLDSPNTTSSTTYKTQGKVLYTQDSGTIVFQSSSNISTMILLEIGA